MKMKISNAKRPNPKKNERDGGNAGEASVSKGPTSKRLRAENITFAERHVFQILRRRAAGEFGFLLLKFRRFFGVWTFGLWDFSTP
jgi:hypothetical protein